MEIGNDWQVLNLGVRMRQSKAFPWVNPSTLVSQFAFGLCAGTESPYGAGAGHFIGIRSSSNWARVGGQSWWQTGWQILSSVRGGESVLSSGSDGTLRVSAEQDNQCSAWYIRYTRLPSALQLNLFLPTNCRAPSEDEFLMQLDRERWNRSVGNHDSYLEVSTEIPFDESLGELDSVNLFSSLPDFVSNQLRAIEWVSVNATRID